MNKDDFYFVWKKLSGDVILTATLKLDPQAIEEPEGRHISAHCLGLKTSARPQEAVHILQPRHPVVGEAQRVQAGPEMAIGIPLPARSDSPVQVRPGPMILR